MRDEPVVLDANQNFKNNLLNNCELFVDLENRNFNVDLSIGWSLI